MGILGRWLLEGTAALAVGAAVRALVGRRPPARLPGVALAVGAAMVLAHWGMAALVVPGGLAAMGFGGRLTRPGVSKAAARRRRRQLVRFWFQVGLLRGAGHSWMQAVDLAADSASELAAAIRSAAAGIARGDWERALATLAAQCPGPEAEAVTTMLAHGFRHGLEAAAILEQAEDMEALLDYEETVTRRGRQPLWAAGLPALLLFNVLVLFAVPMVLSAGRAWLGGW